MAVCLIAIPTTCWILEGKPVETVKACEVVLDRTAYDIELKSIIQHGKIIFWLMPSCMEVKSNQSQVIRVG